jgi:hypothetical protein
LFGLGSMAGLDTALNSIPSWAGTVPQWGLVLLVAIAVVRTSPQWFETWVQARREWHDRHGRRIKDLEEQLAECRRECDEQREIHRTEIDGLRKQRNSEQLAIMRAIVRMSGDPAVKQQLTLLEAMEEGLAQAAEEQEE